MPDTYTFYAEDRIRNRIGAERAAAYEDLKPLLALIEYRFDDAKERTDYGLSRTFQLDTMQGKKRISRIILAAAAPVLWTAVRIKYAFRPKAETRLVFANQFLFSPRYPVVREQVEAKYGCTAVCTFYDTIKRNSPDAKKTIGETLRLDQGKAKPVFLPRHSVAGAALQRAVTDWYRMLYRETFEHARADGAEIDAGLARLRKTYGKRLNWLKKRIGKENLKLYLTVNQYNLRDLLLIQACEELGVETMEQEHHAMQFCGMVFDPENPRPRLSFVRNYGLWNETDRDFHAKVFNYDNVILPDGANRYIVSGNTELGYEQAVRFQQRYPEERKLTFMTAAYEDTDFRTKEELEAYTKWRWKLFGALKELSEKQNLPITIRYTPYSEEYFREREIPTLKEWGFTISESVPANLMEDMCSSRVIMSTTSSVMATALLFGKTIYRVEDGIIDYIHVDDKIHEVRVEDIPGIVVPEEASPKSIDPDGFFEIDRVLQAINNK